MNYDRYEFVFVSEDFREFRFNSVGPNGTIPLIIQFTETGDPGVHNLAFGNPLPDGRVDDVVRNKNLDRNKILATVAIAVYEFTFRFPGSRVFFTGSTSSRNRLYRMAIGLNLELLNKDFRVFGFKEFDGLYYVEQFIAGQDYDEYMVERK